MKKIIVLIGIFCFATSLFAENPIRNDEGKMTAKVFPAVSIGAQVNGLGSFEVIDGLKRTFVRSTDTWWSFAIQGSEDLDLLLEFVNPSCNDPKAPTLKGNWYEENELGDLIIGTTTKIFKQAQVTVFYQLDEIDASGDLVEIGTYTYKMEVKYSYSIM